MPLLVYGMDIDIAVDVTINNFADLIDDVSWEEFMPKGVNKPIFKNSLNTMIKISLLQHLKELDILQKLLMN